VEDHVQLNNLAVILVRGHATVAPVLLVLNLLKDSASVVRNSSSTCFAKMEKLIAVKPVALNYSAAIIATKFVTNRASAFHPLRLS